MNYSINKLSLEILYLPIPRQVRYRVKPVIDMIMYRGSKMIAAGVIFLVTIVFGLAPYQLGFVVLCVVPI